jgi:hypothetical protein
VTKTGGFDISKDAVTLDMSALYTGATAANISSFVWEMPMEMRIANL